MSSAAPVPIFVIVSKEGYDLLVDEDIYRKYAHLNWYLSSKGYASASVEGGKTVRLHRLVMEVDDPRILIDHINSNRLDYRRENLRVASLKENNRNRNKNWNSTLPWKGVQRLTGRRRKPFNARIMVNGESISLGCYATGEEAARAYDAKAKELFGEFASLNFPEE